MFYVRVENAPEMQDFQAAKARKSKENKEKASKTKTCAIHGARCGFAAAPTTE
jgi:hypothetical protein